MAPFSFNCSTDTMALSPTQYDYLYYGVNSTAPHGQFVSYRPPEPEPLWSDLRERDRVMLADTREQVALLATPTPVRGVHRTAYTMRAPPPRSRWERNPLNKRALARR